MPGAVLGTGTGWGVRVEGAEGTAVYKTDKNLCPPGAGADNLVRKTINKQPDMSL